MKRFKTFFKESTAMNNLDMTFINKAMKVTAFNLSSSDFTSTKHKKEIQYLFNLNFFPKFDVTKTLDIVDKERLNSLISMLKKEDIEMFRKLHNYNIKGVGPGEITLYFLLNNCRLGGGSSAGVDVIIGSKGYEVKAVNVTLDRHAINFKLGGNVPLAEIMTELNELRMSLNLPGNKTEMSTTVMKSMKDRAPKDYAIIEAKYAKIAYDSYFRNHEVIFINNSPSSKIGDIEAIKKIELNEIFFERVTSGTVKPKVKL